MENRRRKRIRFTDLRDRWIVSLIIFTCILIAILDFLGIFDNVPLFSGKISNFTLFLLAILTGYVAFTQPEKQETFFEYLSDGLNRIADNLINSSTVTLKSRPLGNIAAALDYAKKQISQAKQRIIVVYPELSPNFYQAVPAAVFYKQIFVVEPENLPKYQNVLLASLLNMPINYSYAGIRCPKEWLQSFVIVDDKELIILSDFLPLTTRNDQFIKVYRESFSAMWGSV
jgi:hypothetical protein